MKIYRQDPGHFWAALRPSAAVRRSMAEARRRLAKRRRTR
jgi:hypothetical protein